MAKKAKKGHEDEELDEDLEDEDKDEDEEEDEKPSKKSKSKDKGKSKGKDKAKKAAKSDDDDLVTVEALAEEAGINAQSARVKFREAELPKPDGGRWRWPEGSKALKAARKALGL